MPEDLEGYEIDFQPSTYFKNIMDFYMLTKVNYKFDKTELEFSEWMDLAFLNQQMEIRR